MADLRARKTIWPRTRCRATRWCASRTCSTPGSARPSGRIRRSAGRSRREELECYYPTSVLVTSRDIITLWVARMVLTGLYNVGEVPFRDVFIHPKILDGYGEGMSKSKGNGVDPIDVIEKFGADSLRFGLAYLTTETQDVRMPVEFECPHCHKLIEQTSKNRMLPRIKCKHCGQRIFDAMGRETGRQGTAARARWSANDSSWPAISATSCGTPRGSR